MSNPTVMIELSRTDAQRLLNSLITTAMIAGDTALPDEDCEGDSSEFGAIDYVDRFTGQLRRQLEKEGL